MQGTQGSTKPSVLFVCVANSYRSQMGEAISRSLGKDGWEMWSAGSHPSGRIHPVAIQLMAEQGISMTGQRSKGLDAVPQREWDYVVTMGCGDACPMVRARTRLDWNVPDPVAMPIEEARRVRDQLAASVRQLIQSL